MSTPLPQHARVVIVGGGIVGCSVAYHLTKMGWTDVVLLEQGQLSCGTTWHAAGLVGQLRAQESMTKLIRYSTALYAELEADTGLATGCKPDGCSGTSTRGQRKLPSFVLSPGASALPSLYPHLPRLVTGVRATLRPVTDRDARCAPRLQCRMLRIGHAARHPARRRSKRFSEINISA